MILKKNDLEKLNNIKPEEEISSIIQETGKLLSLSEQKLNKNCSLKTDLEQIKQLDLQKYYGLFLPGNLYSQSYYEEIKKMLPSFETFLNMPFKERELINDKLKAAFLKEKTYKNIIKMTPAYKRHVKLIFNQEMIDFSSDFLSIVELHKQPKNTFVISMLALCTYIFDVSKKFLNLDLELNLIDLILKIDADELFCNLILIISKSMYANLETKVSDFLVVKQSSVVYIIKNFIYVFFVTLVIDNLSHDKLTESGKDQLIDLFKKNQPFYFLKKKEHETAAFNISAQLLDMLFSSQFFVEKSTVMVKGKKQTYYTLKSVFASLEFFVVHLPSLIPPKKWNLSGKNADNDLLVKKMFSGINTAVFSAEAIKSINVMGKKKHRISDLALNYLSGLLLEKQEKIYNENIVTNFAVESSLQAIEKQEKEVVDLQDKASIYYSTFFTEIKLNAARLKWLMSRLNSRFDLDITNASTLTFSKLSKLLTDKKLIIYIFFLKKNLLLLPQKIALEVSGLTLEQLNSLKELKRLKHEHKKCLAKFSIQSTIFLCAKLLKGFPLFYNNVIDFRGRLYPAEFFFSRTSGWYKYLLANFKSERITSMGLFFMIFNCLINDKELTAAFLKFNDITALNLNIKVNSLKKNFAWFYQRHEKVKPTLDSIYLNIIYLNLINLPSENFMCSFNIEIDQSSSVGCLYGVLFKDAQMLTLCKMQGKTEGLYSHLLNSITDWIPEDNDLFPYFNKNRKLIKQVTMNSLYSQKVRGRTDTIRTILMETHPLNFNSDSFSSELNAKLFKISVDFDTFLKKAVPNCISCCTLTLKLVTIFAKVLQKISIKTVDQITFEWKYNLRGERLNIRVVHPVTQKVVKIQPTMGFTDKLDYDKMKSSFLPCLIHSIDASLVRLITKYMYEKNKFGNSYEVSSIHDAFLLHPNGVLKLYKVIDFIYKTKLNNLFYDCFVWHNYNQLPEDRRIEADNILKQLDLRFKDENKIFLDAKKLNVFDFYLLEGL